MPNLKGWEILIILALILLLFGAKRMPDAARGLGRSLRIFKSETKGLRDDDEKDAEHRDNPGTADSRPNGSSAPVTRALEAPAQPREPMSPRTPAEHEARER